MRGCVHGGQGGRAPHHRIFVGLLISALAAKSGIVDSVAPLDSGGRAGACFRSMELALVARRLACHRDATTLSECCAHHGAGDSKRKLDEPRLRPGTRDLGVVGRTFEQKPHGAPRSFVPSGETLRVSWTKALTYALCCPHESHLHPQRHVHCPDARALRQTRVLPQDAAWGPDWANKDPSANTDAVTG